jgi:hypothetical protein
MSKYDLFETKEQQLQRHLIIALLVVGGILAAVLMYIVHERS